ncbi:uncharacterized protein AMSG_07759 [Thecamonas trahens ATCC 50062]|uniref:PH domain-containing protein n=1 Tax=Thecamonas trahens ATCC 50062 TaxID=461836 RepID=A0A0L0DHJ9_THETB|nr:hypothetical protein AMSG_07759 [Thecamonas trahens ATCC 50062]KNC51695.1 hypothetical protein AMSG_07759 [Thecamonas trahens ATCC 50062]|eukprot:XP_013755824.1 hypothetical protein AMSG_07759 [Thecamonas trahens ATCC 50062]
MGDSADGLADAPPPPASFVEAGSVLAVGAVGDGVLLEDAPPPPPSFLGSPSVLGGGGGSGVNFLDVGDIDVDTFGMPMPPPPECEFNAAPDDDDDLSAGIPPVYDDRIASIEAAAGSDGLLKAGWVYKRGGGKLRSPWQKRFLVLTLDSLTYAPSETKPIKGRINMAHVKKVRYSNDPGEMGKRCGIVVVTLPRTYYFAPETPDELMEWMRLLSQAAKRHRYLRIKARSEANNEELLSASEEDDESEFSASSDWAAEEVIKEGNVLKRAPVKIKWAPCWLSLSNKKITYGSANNSRVAGMIYTKDIEGVLKTIGQREVGEQANCLSLYTADRTYFFSAPSEVELHKWLDVIRIAQEQARAGASDSIADAGAASSATPAPAGSSPPKSGSGASLAAAGSSGSLVTGDEDEDEDDDGEIVLEGLLVKRGGRRSSWRTRWFTVSRQKLTYSASKEKGLKGEFLIRDIKTVLRDIPLKVKRELDKTSRVGITVATVDRTYYLASDDERTLDAWYRVLHRLHRDRKKGRKRPLDFYRQLGTSAEVDVDTLNSADRAALGSAELDVSTSASASPAAGNDEPPPVKVDTAATPGAASDGGDADESASDADAPAESDRNGNDDAPAVQVDKGDGGGTGEAADGAADDGNGNNAAASDDSESSSTDLV